MPALDDRQRAVLLKHRHPTMHSALRFVKGRDERGVLNEHDGFRYGPWWWLYTAETFIRMVASFDNIRIEKTWEPAHAASVMAVCAR